MSHAPMPKHKKPTHKSPTVHEYPAAPGVTTGAANAGHTPWTHPTPAGGMGTSKTQGERAPGPTAFTHPFPDAKNPSHPGNTVGHRVPLTRMLKRKKRGA